MKTRRLTLDRKFRTNSQAIYDDCGTSGRRLGRQLPMKQSRQDMIASRPLGWPPATRAEEGELRVTLYLSDRADNAPRAPDG